jgi:hypothetical protein
VLLSLAQLLAEQLLATGRMKSAWTLDGSVQGAKLMADSQDSS